MLIYTTICRRTSQQKKEFLLLKGGKHIRLSPCTTICFASLLLKRPKSTFAVAYREKQPLCHLFAKPKGGKNLIFNIYHHLPEDSTAEKRFLVAEGWQKDKNLTFFHPNLRHNYCKGALGNAYIENNFYGYLFR